MARRQDLPTVVYELTPTAFASKDARSPLCGVSERLPHLSSLGVDAIALSPLFPASDEAGLHATDFKTIDPALGTEADLVGLCTDASKAGIDVVLSGVFDYVSKEHPWFIAAQSHTDDDEGRYLPDERTRDYFSFSESYGFGYACRETSPDRPELNLKNAELRRRLFTGEDSVLHQWLATGARGWRILHADALGYSILRESSRASMTVLGDHFVIGDIKGFADRYVKDGILDGVVGYYQREAVVSYLRGQIPAQQLARVMEQCSARYKAAFGNGWNILSTYDTPPLAKAISDAGQRRLAVILSFTLPGAAHIRFGEEVGGLAKGGTMSWNEAQWDLDTLALYRALGEARRSLHGLVVGDFVDLTPEGEDAVFAFARTTQDPRHTIIVAINRAPQTRVRKLFAPVTDLPDGLTLRDVDWGSDESPPPVKVRSGTITVELPGGSARILVPDEDAATGARFFRGY